MQVADRCPRPGPRARRAVGLARAADKGRGQAPPGRDTRGTASNGRPRGTGGNPEDSRVECGPAQRILRLAGMPRARGESQSPEAGRRIQGKGGSSVMAHPQLAYNQDRKRQMAYGRWNAWADAGKVRQHVRMLRDNRGTWKAIAEAAGVSTMTVWSVLNLGGEIKAETGAKLLAVTPEDLGPLRGGAGGVLAGRRSAVGVGDTNLPRPRAP